MESIKSILKQRSSLHRPARRLIAYQSLLWKGAVEDGEHIIDIHEVLTQILYTTRLRRIYSKLIKGVEQGVVVDCKSRSCLIRTRILLYSGICLGYGSGTIFQRDAFEFGGKFEVIQVSVLLSRGTCLTQF